MVPAVRLRARALPQAAHFSGSAAVPPPEIPSKAANCSFWLTVWMENPSILMLSNGNARRFESYE